MPIVNRDVERQIVEKGLKEGKDQEFIKQVVLRYREKAQLQEQPLMNTRQEIEASTPQPEQKSVMGFLGNLVKSTGQLVGDVGSAIIHPVQTIKTLGSIPMGVGQKIRRNVEAKKGNVYEPMPEEQLLNAIGKMYKERYGGVKNIGETAYKDPAGVLADLATLLGGAGAVAKVGTAGKVGKIGTAGKIAQAGEIATKASNIIDPLQALLRGGSKVSEVVGKGVGKTASFATGLTTGVGKNVVDEAFKGSKEFIDAMRGKVSSTDIVDIAKNALSNIYKEKGSTYRKYMDEAKATGVVINKEVITAKLDDLLEQFKIKKDTPPLSNEARKYKSAKEFIANFRKEKPEYAMSHRPTQTGATAADISKGGKVIPQDVYTHPEWYGDMSQPTYRESFSALQKVKNNPDAEITIYRASPKNELNNGDWVSLSKSYAKQESLTENTPVQKFKVKAKDIQFAGDDINEFGYYPTDETLKEIHGKSSQPLSTPSLSNEAPLYHGTSAEIKGGKLTYGMKSGQDSGGIFLTDNKDVANVFTFGNGKVYEITPKIKKQVIDLTDTKNIDIFKKEIGKTYRTFDGEELKFTQQDFDTMFPGGKTDFASVSQYPELVQKVVDANKKRGIAFNEYAGGKVGKTYQILNGDVPVNQPLSTPSLSNEAKLNFDSSPISDSAEIKRAVKDVSNWSDWSVEGVDTLKRRVADLWSQNLSGETKTFVNSLKNAIKDELEKVPNYKNATSSYHDFSESIKEIEKSFSLGNKASIDTAANKLVKVLNSNNELRQKFVGELEKFSGKNIKGSIAGFQMSDLFPKGLAKYAAQLTAGGSGLAAFANPQVLAAAIPALLSSSPRIVGEVANVAGKASQGLKTAGKFVGKTASNTALNNLLRTMGLIQKD